jgi:lipid-A-disaccharide synthase
MIVAGEVSGDMHGADLAGSLKAMRPDIKLSGMGGSAMAAAGVEILYDIANLAVMGVTEVIGKLWDIRKAMKTLVHRLKHDRPSLLILIDYPGFNLLLAQKAKRLNIPIMYYISPKVWAWNSGRVKKIKRLVDRMVVILPFEKEFYARHGMAVDFVGNPLLDQVKTRLTRDEFLHKHGIEKADRVVGIFPGSRKQEISSMLPVFLEAARHLQSFDKRFVFLLSQAPGVTVANLVENGFHEEGLTIKVIAEDRYDLMAACDIAMAASGTVTLELAVLNIPMVVAYMVSPLTYFFARRLVKVSSVSLVNLVAGEEIVPELLQHDATPKNISKELQRLLGKGNVGPALREKLKKVSEQLGKPGASSRAAKLALKMLN